MATELNEVLESFHSSFMDKTEIPVSLEMIWLRKAIAEFGTEISPLSYDEETGSFAETLDQYVIDTLATMMKVMYLERCYSKCNKIASIVGKDLSVNSNMSLSKNTKEELDYLVLKTREMLYNLKTSAFN